MSVLMLAACFSIKAAAPAARARARVPVIMVQTQDNDRCFGVSRRISGRRLSVEPRHIHIHDHHIRPQLLRHLDGGAPVRRFIDPCHVRLHGQQRPQCVADHRLIIDQQNSDHTSLGFRGRLVHSQVVAHYAIITRV